LETARIAKKVSKATRLVRLTPAGFIGGIIVDIAIDIAIDKAMEQIGKFASEADNIAKGLKDKIFPDGAVRGPDGKIDGLLEYKFGCPPGVKSGKGVSTGESIPGWSPGQEGRTKDLIAAMKNGDPSAIHPEAVATLLSNVDC
jgi:hypothetical protein